MLPRSILRLDITLMTALTPHPWLDVAWPDLGVAAVPGPDTEARVAAYYADAGHPEIVGDDVAWCAAFVGACLKRAGLSNTRSLLARTYLTYGSSLSEARLGAIAIFSRGADPSQGHVAFIVDGGTGVVEDKMANVAASADFDVMQRDFAGVPLPILLALGIMLVGHIVLRWTKFGRYAYAVGANPSA